MIAGSEKVFAAGADIKAMAEASPSEMMRQSHRKQSERRGKKQQGINSRDLAGSDAS